MSDAGTFRLTAPGDREVVITRSFDAPRGLVFDAFAEPELLKRWLSGPPGWSLTVCEVDPRTGGDLRFVWHGPDGSGMGLRGTYREVTRPERIVHTELFDVDWTGGETLVTTAFMERGGGGSTVTMTILYATREARDAVLRTGMEQGLATSYDLLAEVLAARAR